MTGAAPLLESARKLLRGKPTPSDIRRAVSSTYYALFHHACFHFSQIVVHPQGGSHQRAMVQAYRYIDHGPAKQRCQEAMARGRNFPAGIKVFAEAFADLQQRRNEADYEPSQSFSIADAKSLIVSAEKAVAAFDAEPLAAQRAFVLFIGLRPKNR